MDGTFEMHDDGEELGDDYLYFITGAGEETLLAVAQTWPHCPIFREVFSPCHR